MKVINKMTFRYILKSKLRTLLTLLGIIISISMITSIGNILVTLTSFFKEERIAISGKYDFEIKDINKDDLANILAYENLSDYYVTKKDKSIRNVYEKDGHSDFSFIDVVEGDARYYDGNFSLEIIEGRKPENEGEVIVPYASKDIIPGFNKIGNSVKFNIYDIDESLFKDVFETETSNDFKEKYLVNSNHDETLKIVGYYSSNEIYRSWFSKENNADVSFLRFNIYKFSKIADDKFDFKGFFNDYGNLEEKREQIENIVGKNVKLNDYYIQTNNFRYHDFGEIINGFLTILLVIILVAIVVFIYNIFTTNYVERIKDLGLLKVVGFTNKQLFSMVCLDSLFYFLVSIPLGYVSGVIAMKIVFSYINSILAYNLEGIYYLIEAKTDSMIFTVAAILGFIVILTSNILASNFVFRKSPISALQGNVEDNRKIKIDNRKKRRLTKAIFGYDGFLAFRNIDRNKKRFIMTTISVSMSIILFVVVSNFTKTFENGLFRIKEDSEKISGYIRIETESRDSLMEDLEKIKGLKVRDELKFYTVDNIVRVQDLLSSRTGILVLSDDEYREKIDEDIDKIQVYHEETREFIKGTGVLSLVDRVDTETESEYETKRAINVRFSDSENIEFKNDGYGGFLKITMSKSKFDEIKIANKSYSIFSLQRVGWDKRLKDQLNLIKFNHPKMIAEASPLPTIKIMKLFVYGFITLIASIGALNIINSTYNNILTRRRELALIKAIGIEEKRLKRIILLESMISAFISSILAFVFSLLFTYWQYRVQVDAIPKGIVQILIGSYIFPMGYWAMGVAISFILIYVSAIIPYNRMSKDNITNILK